MDIRKAVAISLTGLMITACTDMGGPVTKAQIGTVMGAVGGAAAGSQFGKGAGNVAMIGLGTLAGAALGNSLGGSLDKIDQQYATRTTQQTLETAPIGQASTWRNPDSGNSGTIVPTRTFEADGMNCREFTQTVIIAGKSQRAYGKACRQPDGSWKIAQ